MDDTSTEARDCPRPPGSFDPARYVRGMERLMHAVQELSFARSLADVQRIVRSAARELTGCDGATFVLRDDGHCYYADEDAIAPLWKGKRFPLEICISGWAMLNRHAAVIPDIYADARIPHVAYQPTFVKSLVMVPIRKLDPIGAIGNYWAHSHHPSEEEVRLLQSLADATSVAMENAQIYGELEQRVRDRTADLEQALQTDVLTGLLNRRGFYQQAEAALREAAATRAELLLAFIDIDGLKQVNDRLGHDGGDDMIIDVARALREALPPDALVARVGGDEFCALLPRPRDGIDALHQQLDDAMTRVNRLGTKPYRVAVSVGAVRQCIDEATLLDALISHADQRMYEHKRSKRPPARVAA
ncbi:MAG: GGDEF domain-containing protein [Nevskiaceae bacterium]|nr:MAG: GGDEF domain-containing protein [Nevskiaceae bacterium]